jgi:exodeoxyribonuclease VII small subunit
MICLSLQVALRKEAKLKSEPQPESESAEPPCFEDALAELETIVHELEDGDLGLGDALARYEQGIKHLKHCFQLLQHAERKIELLTGVKADGTPITQPFDEEATLAEESAGRRRGRAGRPGTVRKSPPSISVAGEDEGDVDGE